MKVNVEMTVEEASVVGEAVRHWMKAQTGIINASQATDQEKADAGRRRSTCERILGLTRVASRHSE